MDHDDVRDEDIVLARIAGTSSRALARQHGCSNSEIEAAIDRRLNYELDGRQRLRQIKLSVARIEGLMLPFYERAVRDKDVSAGTLCCKLEERLSLLLGLDQSPTARVDVYAYRAEQPPRSFQKIREAVYRVAGRQPNGDAPPVEELAADQLELPASDGNGAAPEPK
jgi:hypothetical protein